MSIADPRLTDQDRDLLYLIVISLMKSRITNHLDVKFYWIDIISYGFYPQKEQFRINNQIKKCRLPFSMWARSSKTLSSSQTCRLITWLSIISIYYVRKKKHVEIDVFVPRLWDCNCESLWLLNILHLTIDIVKQ